jgi:1-deoxy-D-xylulose-5-phosphate synthase
VAIYSTFLQRGYDQLFQELLIQNARVVLALDRAGLVDDGATHHGPVRHRLPACHAEHGAHGAGQRRRADRDARLRAPPSEGPIALRYPRDAAPAAPGPIEPIELGRARDPARGARRLVVAYGTMVELALAAADLLAERGIEALVVNARFAKPIDGATMAAAARTPLLVTLEEHAVAGGFGAAVLEALSEHGERVAAFACSSGCPTASSSTARAAGCSSVWGSRRLRWPRGSSRHSAFRPARRCDRV